MTITADAPATMPTIDSTVTVRPENVFEARTALRNSSNRKNSSAKRIHLHAGILEGQPVFEVTGSSTSNPIKVFIASGACTLKVSSGEIIVENTVDGSAEVLYASKASLS